MNALDFLAVAGEWAVGSREAEWRSAASRAYYAAFHVARELLEGCGFVVPTAEPAHSYLWLRLANAGQPDIQAAGNKLRELRRYRNWADYDLRVPFPDFDAVGQVQDADDVIQLLQAVQGSPAIRTRITAAIQVYERDVLKRVTWRS